MIILLELNFTLLMQICKKTSAKSQAKAKKIEAVAICFKYRSNVKKNSAQEMKFSIRGFFIFCAVKLFYSPNLNSPFLYELYFQPVSYIG